MVMDKFSFQNETSPPSTGTLLSFLHFIALKREPQVVLSVSVTVMLLRGPQCQLRLLVQRSHLTGQEDNCHT